ncbi:MAG: class I fructose-bisphosphate aldolase [Dehalococcoidales bacterium]|nr:class I fructose-bisphosphate aldolase [Dehalococcoidales bacterium]
MTLRIDVDEREGSDGIERCAIFELIQLMLTAVAALLSSQFEAELIANAKLVATPGKGILAADESTGTIGSRFDEIKVANTHENRIEYRRLLFTTQGLEQYISGVILFEETLFDKGQASRQKQTRSSSQRSRF